MPRGVLDAARYTLTGFRIPESSKTWAFDPFKAWIRVSESK
jgi:hypothetical protein